MTSRTLLYTVVIWVLFVIASSANDWITDVSSSPELGEYGGHVYSVMRLFAFVVAVIYIFVRFLEIRRYTPSDLLFIGLFWFVLSAVFEFVYKHYFKRYSWNTVLGNYNILEGRLMGFVLLAELFGPYLFGIRRLSILRGAYRDDGGS